MCSDFWETMYLDQFQYRPRPLEDVRERVSILNFPTVPPEVQKWENRLKAKLLLKTINYLSFELGYPKEELVAYIKQAIQERKL